ncbi:hypothetical protein M501DRAFT_998429 [Patellaria atrata CBS 101060]|uniref:Uncharacterized protein n=1 Tax=Patellaria atrata CBS 101060 TaxID=1346257 RepID=A0A9P4VVY9_9PEZI|nr:hypothetical protein M501DRAFT_998429 [Patellaria atrata CBS 101060]
MAARSHQPVHGSQASQSPKVIPAPEAQQQPQDARSSQAPVSPSYPTLKMFLLIRKRAYNWILDGGGGIDFNKIPFQAGLHQAGVAILQLQRDLIDLFTRFSTTISEDVNAQLQHEAEINKERIRVGLEWIEKSKIDCVTRSYHEEHMAAMRRDLSAEFDQKLQILQVRIERDTQRKLQEVASSHRTQLKEANATAEKSCTNELERMRFQLGILQHSMKKIRTQGACDHARRTEGGMNSPFSSSDSEMEVESTDVASVTSNDDPLLSLRDSMEAKSAEFANMWELLEDNSVQLSRLKNEVIIEFKRIWDVITTELGKLGARNHLRFTENKQLWEVLRVISQRPWKHARNIIEDGKKGSMAYVRSMLKFQDRITESESIEHLDLLKKKIITALEQKWREANGSLPNYEIADKRWITDMVARRRKELEKDWTSRIEQNLNVNLKRAREVQEVIDLDDTRPPKKQKLIVKLRIPALLTTAMKATTSEPNATKPYENEENEISKESSASSPAQTFFAELHAHAAMEPQKLQPDEHVHDVEPENNVLSEMDNEEMISHKSVVGTDTHPEGNSATTVDTAQKENGTTTPIEPQEVIETGNIALNEQGHAIPNLKMPADNSLAVSSNHHQERINIAMTEAKETIPSIDHQVLQHTTDTLESETLSEEAMVPKANSSHEGSMEAITASRVTAVSAEPEPFKQAIVISGPHASVGDDVHMNGVIAPAMQIARELFDAADLVTPQQIGETIRKVPGTPILSPSPMLAVSPSTDILKGAGVTGHSKETAKACSPLALNHSHGEISIIGGKDDQELSVPVVAGRASDEFGGFTPGKMRHYKEEFHAENVAPTSEEETSRDPNVTESGEVTSSMIERENQDLSHQRAPITEVIQIHIVTSRDPRIGQRSLTSADVDTSTNAVMTENMPIPSTPATTTRLEMSQLQSGMTATTISPSSISTKTVAIPQDLTSATLNEPTPREHSAIFNIETNQSISPPSVEGLLQPQPVTTASRHTQSRGSPIGTLKVEKPEPFFALPSLKDTSSSPGEEVYFDSGTPDSTSASFEPTHTDQLRDGTAHANDETAYEISRFEERKLYDLGNHVDQDVAMTDTHYPEESLHTAGAYGPDSKVGMDEDVKMERTEPETGVGAEQTGEAKGIDGTST